MPYIFAILYPLILLGVAFVQIGFLSLISLLIYWFFSGKRPSKKQVLFCAATMVVLNIIMLAYAAITGTLDATVPHWHFFVYCAVLVAAGILAAKSSANRSVLPKDKYDVSRTSR